MNVISSLNRSEKIGLSLVVVFLIISRFWYLSILPAALTHDEVVYAIQAKSLAVQNTFLNQKDSWLSLQPAHPMYAEFPALILAPFFKIFDDPILATRVPSALIGIAFPFVLSWFSYGLWKRRDLSIWVFIVSIFNPLLWQMGRLTYDAVFSTFFYFIAGSIILNTKGKSAYWSVIFFLLGFFEYQGYKLLLLPWLLFLTAILLIKFGKSAFSKPHFISLLITSILLPLYALFILPNQNIENRWQKTIFADSEYLSAVVNDERRLTINNPLLPLVSNKLTAAIKYMSTRFFGAFSPSMLFLDGEPAQSGFAPWGYGWFHAVDFFLLLIGFGYMWVKKSSRTIKLPMGLFIIAATIPSLVNSGDPWYLLRMFFPNLILLLFVAWGGWFLWRTRLGKWLLIPAYSLSIFLFTYHFYFRYPVVGNNISYLSEKVMAEYVVRTHKNNPDLKIYVHTVDPPVMFWTYLLYANAVDESSVDQIVAARNGDEFIFDGIVFTGKCADVVEESAVRLSEAFRIPCDYFQSEIKNLGEAKYNQKLKDVVDKMITIPSIVDNGAQWRIYNDQLCQNAQLTGFVRIQNYDDFVFSTQDNIKFCQTWFSNVESN